MLKKKFLKTQCKVEFIFPAHLVESIQSVHLVGEFNNWSETDTPLELNDKDKTYRTILSLKLNKRYEFRYLVNGTEWHNEWEADGYAPNAFGGENAVVDTTAPAE